MHRPTPPPPPKIPHFSLSSHKVPHLSPSLLHNSLGLQLTSKGKGGQCRGNKGSANRRFGFLSLSLSLVNNGVPSTRAKHSTISKSKATDNSFDTHEATSQVQQS